jgi:hypothetical protein
MIESVDPVVLANISLTLADWCSFAKQHENAIAAVRNVFFFVLSGNI